MPDDDAAAADALSPLVLRHADTTARLLRHLLLKVTSPEERDRLLNAYSRVVYFRMIARGVPEETATKLLLATYGSLCEGLQDNLEGEP
jgi:hypothetical protein